MNRKLILIIGGVVVAACIVVLGLVALAGGLSLGLTQPSATAGDEFMTALKNGDFGQAYDLCSPALQRAIGSVKSLESKIKSGHAQPAQWTFQSRKMNGDAAELSGNVTFSGNSQGTVRLDLARTNDTWKITAFNLMPK